MSDQQPPLPGNDPPPPKEEPQPAEPNPPSTETRSRSNVRLKRSKEDLSSPSKAGNRSGPASRAQSKISVKSTHSSRQDVTRTLSVSAAPAAVSDAAAADPAAGAAGATGTPPHDGGGGDDAAAKTHAPYEMPAPGPAVAPGNSTLDIPAAGILPLFLTSMTQELFKVKTGEDITAERPVKIIPKADLLADVQARLAISDFQPAKAQIMEYPGDELLLFFDSEYKYGQNFFLCISPSAVDAILRPPTAPTATEEQLKKSKRPEPKEWVSLGSDLEMLEESVQNTRDLIHLKVSRKRKEFGVSINFSDKSAADVGVLECKSFKDPAYELNKMELSTTVQAVSNFVTRSVQTTWNRPVNFSSQYEPLSMESGEQLRLLRTDDMIEFVKDVSQRFEQALRQNIVIDIFEDDFKALGDEDANIEQASHTYLQEYQSFTDLKHSKDKSISCIDWHPTQKGVVAVSCVGRFTLDERIEIGFPVRSKSSLILIWSFHDPIHPQLILEAPEDINTFQFNPSDPNLIAGGCISGQIFLWDISEHQERLRTTRKAAAAAAAAHGDNASGGIEEKQAEANIPVVKHVAASSTEFSHRALVSDLQWMPGSYLIGHNGEATENPEGSSSRQLVTCSLDGQVSFWDIRSKKDYKQLDLMWKPFLRVPLSSMDNTFDYGLLKVALKLPGMEKDVPAEPVTPSSREKTAEKGEKEPLVPSKFYVATEEGDLLYTDWILEKATEDKASRVEHALSWHFGPISDLQRSPFLPDILLSVGGWSFHIWKEKNFACPLLSSPTATSYLISGRWSPTRPGVFYISKADGTIEIWDLVDQSHQPTTIQNVSSIGISCMSVHQYKGGGAQQFLGAADDEGTLHVLEVPRNLAKEGKNEV
ncbi:WD40-repeat-containing domain protein [Zopfochytrium polystomum]|nr:WD40-repeat-containing domain protein [Zopfochytrium polystomum]